MAYSRSAQVNLRGQRQRWLLPVDVLEEMEQGRTQEETDLQAQAQPAGTMGMTGEESGARKDTRVQGQTEGASADGHSPNEIAAGHHDGDKLDALPDANQPTLPVFPLHPEIYQNRRSVAVKVIEETEITRLVHAIKSGDKARDNRIQELHKRLSSLGAWRHHLYPLCQQPASALTGTDTGMDTDVKAGDGAGEHCADQDGHQVAQDPSSVLRAHIEASFAPLYRAHPHFREVVDLYRDCAVAAVNHTGTADVMSPPPVLLLGAPGLGKTHFAKALAKVLGLPIVTLSFDAGLTNAALLGSDRHWGNTHHGALFENLCLGTVANPLLLLDEIDKAPANRESYQSPLAALHSCLEPVSAVQVRDISVDVSFNASHVLWLATANDSMSIPATVLSRFTTFHVLPPVGEDAYWLTLYLCKAVLASDRGGINLPSGEMRAALSVFSPRLQRSSLQTACQRARTAGRTELRAEDFPADVRQEMTVHNASMATRRHSGRLKKPNDLTWYH